MKSEMPEFIKVCIKWSLQGKTPKLLRHKSPDDYLKIVDVIVSFHFFITEKKESTESVSESEQLMSQGQYLRV